MRLLQLLERDNPDVKVKKKGHIYHAYLKSKWVGQAMVNQYEVDGMDDNMRHIWKSAVDPEYQRQGVATELYNFIADDLESQGLKLVPSPDQQLSPEAYQFWKSRDPESIKQHGTFKAENLQHLVGRELDLRGRPVIVHRVGWSKNTDTPLLGVRYTDVPEGSANSQSTIRWDDAKDQLSESVSDQIQAAGMRGFGGNCFQAAIDINNQFFNGEGEYVLAYNKAFMDHGVLYGHAAVLHDGVYWDADGKPKEVYDIESWGMLDEDDPDYIDLAKELGFVFDENTAYDVGMKVVDENTLRQYCPINEEDGIKLPDLEVDDELMVGKFKNRKATIKGFTKDKHNQPIAKTDKGDQQIFKGRVAKLMPVREDEGDGAAASPQVEAFYKEFYGMTTPHPDDETARIIMANDGDGDYVVIQSRPEGDRVYLKAIQSTRPGWGHGGEAMQLFLGLTDKHGVPVDLSVEAVGNVEGGLNNQQLTDWYSELGFEPHQKFGDRMFNIKRMKREPRGAVTESFNRTTTEMPDYDKLIQSIDSEYLRDYFRDQKGKEAKMVDISPDEYLQAVDRGFDHGVMNGIEDEKVQRYAAKMKAGETFPALTLDYSIGYLSQEGRHRALAAKAVGIDSVPVLVVTPTPEEAEYRGITMPNHDMLKTMEPRPMREGPVKIGGASQAASSFMNDYNTSTVAHPFMPSSRIAMNSKMNTGDDFAILEVQPYGDDRIYLGSIQSSQAGNGNGSAGLKLVTDLADKNGVVLELDVDAFGEAADKLTNSQLRQWYSRAGFAAVENKHVRDRNRMERQPQ